MKKVFSDSILEKDSVTRKFRITAVNGKNDIEQKATVKNGLIVQGYGNRHYGRISEGGVMHEYI
jgi:hypothetical protein